LSKVQLQHGPASKLAARIVEAIADGCQRVEVAGSVRRHEPFVGDIEVVAIAQHLGGMFPGQLGHSLLEIRLENLVGRGKLLDGGLNGPRQKRFAVPAVAGLMLDLFIVPPEEWGVQLAIRTGPAEFSRALVTQRAYGGRLSDQHVVHQGRVWRRRDVRLGIIVFDHAGKCSMRRTTEPLPGAVPLDTPEERDFLAVAGGWLPPEARRVDAPISEARCTEPVEARA
jgi:hypothetical protein